MNNETFFDKEEYFKFIDAWKGACNDDDVVLSAAHHIILNVVKGRDPKVGFTPCKNEGRLNARGKDPYFAFNTACKFMEWIATEYRASVSPPPHSEEHFTAKFARRGWTYADYVAQWARSCDRQRTLVGMFLMPFLGTFTGEDLCRVCDILSDLK